MILAWEHSPEWSGLRESTKAWYVRSIRPLVGMEHTPLQRVERKHIVDIRNALAFHRGHGAATAFVRATSALFWWAVENGRLANSPIAKIKRLRGGHIPAWSDAEAALAIEHLPEHLRRVVVLALYTGQRRGDLIALTWRQYDGSAIHLTQRKTVAAVQIPCHPVLKEELDSWRRGSVVGIGGATILVNSLERPWRPDVLSWQLTVALGRIEGFPPGKSLHGLRKLSAANLAEAGCTVHEIASITGHKTLAMVELYTASARQKRLAEVAIRKLREGGGGASPA